MTIVVDIGNTSVLLGKIENNIIIDQLRFQTESIKIELDNKSYSVNTDKGIDISIPTDFKKNKSIVLSIFYRYQEENCS